MKLMTKLLTSFCVLLTLGILFASCNGKNQAAQEPEETMSLTAADTAQVAELMNQYFDLLMKKDFDAALSMLSQLRNDSLSSVPEDVAKHYMMGMKLVTPIRYEVDEMTFRKDWDCLVKYSAVLFEKDSVGDNRPNKMTYAIKPVRFNGQWHLTVADKNDSNTQDSKIEN
jgi:hypothetical protein